MHSNIPFNTKLLHRCCVTCTCSAIQLIYYCSVIMYDLCTPTSTSPQFLVLIHSLTFIFLVSISLFLPLSLSLIFSLNPISYFSHSLLPFFCVFFSTSYYNVVFIFCSYTFNLFGYLTIPFLIYTYISENVILYLLLFIFHLLYLIERDKHNETARTTPYKVQSKLRSMNHPRGTCM